MVVDQHRADAVDVVDSDGRRCRAGAGAGAAAGGEREREGESGDGERRPAVVSHERDSCGVGRVTRTSRRAAGRHDIDGGEVGRRDRGRSRDRGGAAVGRLPGGGNVGAPVARPRHEAAALAGRGTAHADGQPAARVARRDGDRGGDAGPRVGRGRSTDRRQSLARRVTGHDDGQHGGHRQRSDPDPRPSGRCSTLTVARRRVSRPAGGGAAASRSSASAGVRQSRYARQRQQTLTLAPGSRRRPRRGRRSTRARRRRARRGRRRPSDSASVQLMASTPRSSSARRRARSA